jgi:hypothetical protein
MRRFEAAPIGAVLAVWVPRDAVFPGGRMISVELVVIRDLTTESGVEVVVRPSTVLLVLDSIDDHNPSSM